MLTEIDSLIGLLRESTSSSFFLEFSSMHLVRTKVWIGPSTSSDWAHGLYSILRSYPSHIYIYILAQQVPHLLGRLGGPLYFILSYFLVKFRNCIELTSTFKDIICSTTKKKTSKILLHQLLLKQCVYHIILF